ASEARCPELLPGRHLGCPARRDGLDGRDDLLAEGRVGARHGLEQQRDSWENHVARLVPVNYIGHRRRKFAVWPELLDHADDSYLARNIPPLPLLRRRPIDALADRLGVGAEGALGESPVDERGAIG